MFSKLATVIMAVCNKYDSAFHALCTPLVITALPINKPIIWECDFFMQSIMTFVHKKFTIHFISSFSSVGCDHTLFYNSYT